MTDDIAKEVTRVTLEDIDRVQGLALPPEELSEYWIRYSNDVPETLRKSISKSIYLLIGVKLLWISGSEAKIQLYE